MTPQLATLIAWGVFIISWIAAAFWADRTEKRPARREEWLYRGLTVAGAFLLFRGGVASASAAHRIWALGGGDWAMFALVVAGFAFAWWARLHLGRLWSSSVTKKADHRVVDTGPYGLVRHPIYTGLLLSIAATAGQLGTAAAVAGVLAFLAGFWIKARLEERFLRAELGEGDYDAYRRRVPMLCLWVREDKAGPCATRMARTFPCSRVTLAGLHAGVARFSERLELSCLCRRQRAEVCSAYLAPPFRQGWVMANEFRTLPSHSAEYFGDTRDYWWNPDFLALIAERLMFDRVREALTSAAASGTGPI